MSETVKGYVTRRLAAFALAVGLAVGLGLVDQSLGRPGAAVVMLTGVARVVDGDTISVGLTRVRLEGIDAPEAGQTCGRRWIGTWRCGAAATHELAKLIDGRPVACESRGVDKYGRVLATCFHDKVDVSAEMVRRGMAWAFVRYSTAYVEIEAEARAARRGVWTGTAMAPWDFRAGRWRVAEQAAPEGCAIKGNVTKNGRIYHMPWSPWYERIRIDAGHGKRWFCSEAEAIAAGWRAAYTQ